MKSHRSFPRLLLGLLALLTPALLLADPATDRKIESTLTSSYNFRTVLDNKVTVQAEAGTVTLTGTVLDRAQKSLAETTARNVPGVTTVENRLHVASGPAERSDGWIALKIRSTLLVHANVSATQTRVEVNDGLVTLTGSADTEAQKELTEAYVMDIEGVKSVKNDLQVAVDPAAKSSVREAIDDTSITAQVKYELLTHRSTSALKTKVETRSGHVSIQGDASSDAERDLVTKLARGVRGVASVENRMTVRAAE